VHSLCTLSFLNLWIPFSESFSCWYFARFSCCLSLFLLCEADRCPHVKDLDYCCFYLFYFIFILAYWI
jgi:hypothetical protein